ncbi:MAG TPA: hypothetical protein VI776_17740 [Anaerolineales bacterium]|nr:hypothetical protein [Anaerolineales bacterium]
MRRLRILHNWFVGAACLVLVSFALSSCEGTNTPALPVVTGVVMPPDYSATPVEEIQSQELSWMSLERTITDNSLIAEKFKKPDLRIFARPQDFEEQGEFTSVKELADRLLDFDYENSFAILVLEGEDAVRTDQVTVTDILQQGDRVIVRAELPGPFKENEEVGTLVTLPYHLVAVRKDGEWGQEMTFVLVGITDGVETTLLETAHFIP